MAVGSAMVAVCDGALDGGWDQFWSEGGFALGVGAGFIALYNFKWFRWLRLGWS